MEASTLPRQELASARAVYNKLRRASPTRSNAPGFAVRDCGYRTPCYVWLGAKNRHGYGRMIVRGEDRLVHSLVIGTLAPGLVPDHLCRTHACFRPDHLEAVTQLVNVRRGAATRLTAVDVAAIRASPLSQRALGRRYGVSHTQIGHIKHGRRWRREEE